MPRPSVDVGTGQLQCPSSRSQHVRMINDGACAVGPCRESLLWPTWCPSDDVGALQLRLGAVRVVTAHDKRVVQRGSCQVLAHL